MSQRRYRALLFILLGACYLTVYFHRNAVGVVALDMMSDLKIDAAVMGMLSAGYFYPYAFMQLPTGILTDSWGPRKTLVSFLVLSAVGSFLFGMSYSSSGVLVGRILVGIGVSTVYICTLKLISQWYHGDEFATMNSLLVAIGGVGLLASTVPMAWASDIYGWRMPFVATGAITVVLIIIAWLFVHDSPHARIRDNEGPPRHPRLSVKNAVLTILGSRRFWPACIWLMCSFSLYIAFGGLWGAPYLMHVYGLSKADASGILMMIAFGMIVGSPAVGLLSDKVLKRRKPVHIASSLLLVAIMALFVTWTDSLPLFSLYILMFLFGIAAVGALPVGYASIKDLFPVEMAGTTTGIANLFPFLLGAVLQPIMGYILEQFGKNGDTYSVTGYQYAISVLLVCAVVAFICSFFIKETSSHRTRESKGELP